MSIREQARKEREELMARLLRDKGRCAMRYVLSIFLLFNFSSIRAQRVAVQVSATCDHLCYFCAALETCLGVLLDAVLSRDGRVVLRCPTLPLPTGRSPITVHAICVHACEALSWCASCVCAANLFRRSLVDAPQGRSFLKKVPLASLLLLT